MTWPTISDYILDATEIWAQCGRCIPCGHDAKLDLPATLASHGDIRLPELRHRLKCPCSYRGARLTLIPSRLVRNVQEIERRKRLIAEAVARGAPALDAAPAEIRAGKPSEIATKLAG